MTAPSSTRPRLRIDVPPQHGAWAFLVVPLILAAGLGAATWVGLLFAVAWVAAYPVGYFVGGAVATRIRRGSWTVRARRELRSSVPWLVVAVTAAAALIVMRPWLVVAGVGIIALYGVSISLAVAGRERGIVNDLLLVLLATLAIPLMWMTATDTPDPAAVPEPVRWAMVVSLVFFTGSVLHVKSLIREARDHRWHVASVAFHAVALVGMSLVSWWFALCFGVALLRAIVLRPGLRPARIGAIETVVAVLVIAATFLAAASRSLGA